MAFDPITGAGVPEDSVTGQPAIPKYTPSGAAFTSDSPKGLATTLADAIEATGAQTAATVAADGISWPATFALTTTGRGATDDTVVVIEVSNDGFTTAIPYATLSVVGNSYDSIVGGNDPWLAVRANCTTMDNAGTGSATLIMGC